MPTPDLNKEAGPPLSFVRAPTTKLRSELAMVLVHKSSYLHRGYQLIFVLFALGFISASMPWLLASLWWCLVGIAFLIMLWWCYRRQVSSIFNGRFWYEQGRWHLRSDLFCCRGKLSGDVICWPMLIVLPIRDDFTGKTKHFLICKDALSEADNARLRTWLRVCLRPKG